MALAVEAILKGLSYSEYVDKFRNSIYMQSFYNSILNTPQGNNPRLSPITQTSYNLLTGFFVQTRGSYLQIQP